MIRICLNRITIIHLNHKFLTEKRKNQKHAPEELVGQKTNAKNQEDKIPTTFIEAKQEDYFYLFKDISSFDFDLVQGLRSTSH